MRFIAPFLLMHLVFAICVPGSAAGAPTLDDTRKRLEAGEPTRIVCFGDSITGAYYHSGGLRAWCDMLGIALKRLHPTAEIEMINAGVSGHTTVQALERIERDVLAKKPHLVVVMFGMNDVARLSLDAYAANLETIVEKCQGAGAAVLLSTPNAVHENPQRPNGKLAELAERIGQLARRKSLPLVDCFADYRNLREQDEVAFMLLMSDEIHPNMHGHRRFAELMAERIAGRRVSLDDVPPPADSLGRTLSRLESGEAIHVVAMPPYDAWLPAALREQYPQAQIRVTRWPTQSQSLHDLSQWATRIRELQPDLVVPAVPVDAAAADTAAYIRDYEWTLNRSFPFAGRAWDVAPALPSVAAPREASQPESARLARRILQGKDVHYLERAAGDERDGQAILAEWIAEQRKTLRQK